MTEMGDCSVTEKELRKLNRYQLLELLVAQTERANALEEKLEKVQSQLDSHDIRMSVVGSIAEASLQLSGIFNTAQNAADLYLNAVRDRADQMEEEAEEKARAIIEDAEIRARQIIQAAQVAAHNRMGNKIR